MNDVQKWYALYTRPRWEKKVGDLLVKYGYVSYCPMNWVTRQWSDRRKTLYQPLFSCYVFVRLTAAEIPRVKSVSGVISFVSWLGKPAIIKDAEIEVIRQFLAEHTNVHIEKIQVDVDDVVKIVEGPLMHYEGSILSIIRNKVKVFLPTLGYSMVAEVDRDNLKLVKKAKQAVNHVNQKI